jgi:hypothetical protein
VGLRQETEVVGVDVEAHIERKVTVSKSAKEM